MQKETRDRVLRKGPGHVQGRVTREVRADGVTDTHYTYDGIGRLKTVTDPKEQLTTHTYLIDDSLLSTVWTNAAIATPGVSYTYDPSYARVVTMVDGIGTTAYTYKPSAQLGAGQVASVDGPLANDTITYTYDQLGRVTSGQRPRHVWLHLHLTHLHPTTRPQPRTRICQPG